MGADRTHTDSHVLDSWLSVVRYPSSNSPTSIPYNASRGSREIVAVHQMHYYAISRSITREQAHYSKAFVEFEIYRFIL